MRHLIRVCSSALVATTLVIGSIASSRGALADEFTIRSVPVRLIGGAAPLRDGTCSVCAVDDLILNDDDEAAASTAAFDLYFEDEGGDLVADLKLFVALSDGFYREILLPEVQLVSGCTHTVRVRAGADWSWAEADVAFLDVSPRAPDPTREGGDTDDLVADDREGSDPDSSCCDGREAVCAGPGDDDDPDGNIWISNGIQPSELSKL